MALLYTKHETEDVLEYRWVISPRAYLVALVAAIAAAISTNFFPSHFGQLSVLGKIQLATFLFIVISPGIRLVPTIVIGFGLFLRKALRGGTVTIEGFRRGWPARGAVMRWEKTRPFDASTPSALEKFREG